jgi:predicted nucleic acid-binding protein
VILVDTSVWVDHLRSVNTRLRQLLEGAWVVAHPFVIGELALGNLRQRDTILETMHDLPQTNVATDLEVLHFIHKEAIFGRGIGYVDAHLLASIRLTPGTSLWTRDKRLHEVADQLGLVMAD